MEILDIISAIATSAAAIAAWRAVQLSRQTIEEGFRPQLVMFYRRKDKIFKIRNVGKATAMNISLRIINKEGIEVSADLGEAVSVPPEDEQPVHFYIGEDKKAFLLTESPISSSIHAIFNPKMNNGISYKFEIKYEDIAGKIKYLTKFETLADNTRHLFTRKLGK